MKVKALDEGNCGAARHGGKEAGVKAMSPRTETGYEAGDADELVPHNEVPVSASQVKSGVVLRKFTPLPGETWPPCGDPRASERHRSTVTGNSRGERPGVSRGRSSARRYEPGVSDHPKWGAPKAPEGLTTARRTKLIRSAETATTCQLRSWCGRVRRRKTALSEGVYGDRLFCYPKTGNVACGSFDGP